MTKKKLNEKEGKKEEKRKRKTVYAWNQTQDMPHGNIV